MTSLHSTTTHSMLWCLLAAIALSGGGCSSDGDDATAPDAGTGGDNAAVGGSQTGGALGLGGTVAVGSGGTTTTGGALGSGGNASGGASAGSTGGSSTGGAGTGGLGTGGRTGGTGTGGTTGGLGTGGTGTGGVGPVEGTGGSGTGGRTGGWGTGGRTGGLGTGGRTGGLGTGGTTDGLGTGGTTDGLGTGGVGAGGAGTGGVGIGGSDEGGSSSGGGEPGGDTGSGGVSDGGSTSSGGTAGTGNDSTQYCPADEPCRISPLGDSITEGMNIAGGYRTKLFSLALADGKDITFVGTRSNGPNEVDGQPFPKNHEGTSGISIEGLQAEVEAGDLIREDVQPHIILLHIGTNNMYGSHPAQPAQLLPSLLDKIIEDCPDALLVVAQIIPYNGVDTLNAAIPAMVEERAAAGAHIMLVDQNTGFPQNELADGVHPNQAGYDRMGRVWYETIKDFLP